MTLPVDLFAMGFAAAQRAAVRLCHNMAEDLDVRTETARLARMRPIEPVRRLRQAASRIRELDPAEERGG